MTGIKVVVWHDNLAVISCALVASAVTYCREFDTRLDNLSGAR